MQMLTHTHTHTHKIHTCMYVHKQNLVREEVLTDNSNMTFTAPNPEIKVDNTSIKTIFTIKARNKVNPNYFHFCGLVTPANAAGHG